MEHKSALNFNCTEMHLHRNQGIGMGMHSFIFIMVSDIYAWPCYGDFEKLRPYLIFFCTIPRNDA